MSAPGVQLYSPVQGNYFEPDVRAYIQKIEQAVVSNNLAAAQQAFVQLDTLVHEYPPAASKAGGWQSPEAAKSVAAIGQALKEGDLDGAATALAGLRANLSVSASGTASTESQTPGQTSDEDTTPSSNNVNVRI